MSSCISNLELRPRSLWTGLPGDVLSNIISRLGLPRYLTVITISATTFDIELGDTIYNVSVVWNILNNLFSIFNSSSINSFRLRLPCHLYPPPCCYRIIDSWASHLCLSNVQHAEVTSYGYNWFHIGDRIEAPKVFLMHSLVSLDLDLCIFGFVWSIPNSINLPNLKKLSLIFVKCACLERLINSCPLLEDLSLAHKSKRTHASVEEEETLIVATKKLKQLCIILHESSSIEVNIDAPRLEHFNYVDLFLMHGEISKRMFDSISHVNSLVLDIATPMTLYPTIFPKVTHLTWAFDSSLTFDDLVSMLHNCPSLEGLVLQLHGFHCTSLIPQDTFVPFEHVKRIELHSYEVRLDQEMLGLATYLLRSTPVLDKLILNADVSSGIGQGYNDHKTQFKRSLIECARCSSRCQIDFSGEYHS